MELQVQVWTAFKGVGSIKTPPVFVGDGFPKRDFLGFFLEKKRVCLKNVVGILDELLFVLVMMIIMLVILLFHDYHTCLLDIRFRK